MRSTSPTCPRAGPPQAPTNKTHKRHILKPRHCALALASTARRKVQARPGSGCGTSRGSRRAPRRRSRSPPRPRSCRRRTAAQSRGRARCLEGGRGSAANSAPWAAPRRERLQGCTEGAKRPKPGSADQRAAVRKHEGASSHRWQLCRLSERQLWPMPRPPCKRCTRAYI